MLGCIILWLTFLTHDFIPASTYIVKKYILTHIIAYRVSTVTEVYMTHIFLIVYTW